MAHHESSRLHEREDILALGLRIASIRGALDSVIALGSAFGIKDRVKSQQITLNEPELSYRETFHSVWRFSKVHGLFLRMGKRLRLRSGW